ncbi:MULTISPECIES: acyltransferase family protein [unclassified Sphingomonas]|uniref:acyltransferase family protein n=1 Tax=Novosphingobium rhizosphaerae TaxID=1551649 RepID=UPI0015C7B89A
MHTGVAANANAGHARLLYLDGWRGLAILLVLIGHFVAGVPQLGGFGVDLFLVLSGRLMAQILIDERFPLKAFFLRRFSRIYPTLLVFSSLIFAVSLLARWRHMHFNSLVSPLDYFAALTMWMNYKVAFFGEAGALNHIWSISVEEHAYISLAALAALLSRSRKVGLLVAVLAVLALINGFVLSAVPGATEHTVFWRSDVRVAPLFLSFALFLAPERIHAMLGRVTPVLLLGAVVVPFSGLSAAWQLVLDSVLLAGAVNGLAHAPMALRRVLENPAIRYVGVTSYSIYLWQQPFYTLHERVTSLILLPATFAVALISFYVVEQPARRAINGWLARRSA